MIDISLVNDERLGISELCKQSATRKINKLNNEFFSKVELSEEEQRTLVWLCGWEESTINNIVSAFKKAKRN